MPVKPNDRCFWERLDKTLENDVKNKLGNSTEPYFVAKLESELKKGIEVHQVRTWSDGKNGYIETTDQ